MTYDFDDSLGYLLNIVAGKFRNEVYSVLAPYGITPGQLMVISQLSAVDGKTQRQLADETYKDEPNIARILRILENKGYIYKASDPRDRRISLVYITEEGRRLGNTVEPLMLEYNRRMASCLTPQEVLTLKNLLRKMKSDLYP